MKKLLILAAVIASVGFAACKKKENCFTCNRHYEESYYTPPGNWLPNGKFWGDSVITFCGTEEELYRDIVKPNTVSDTFPQSPDQIKVITITCSCQ